MNLVNRSSCKILKCNLARGSGRTEIYDFRSLVTPLFCRWFMKQFVKREFHSRSKFFACLLTFCAGFIDAYTFIERGGTLVAGQTGNVVFLSVELINQETRGIEVKLATMLAFMLGIFLMTVFQHHFEHSWRRLSSIFPLILTTAVAGFCQQMYPIFISCHHLLSAWA